MFVNNFNTKKLINIFNSATVFICGFNTMEMWFSCFYLFFDTAGISRRLILCTGIVSEYLKLLRASLPHTTFVFSEMKRVFWYPSIHFITNTYTAIMILELDHLIMKQIDISSTKIYRYYPK